MRLPLDNDGFGLSGGLCTAEVLVRQLEQSDYRENDFQALLSGGMQAEERCLDGTRSRIGSDADLHQVSYAYLNYLSRVLFLIPGRNLEVYRSTERELSLHSTTCLCLSHEDQPITIPKGVIGDQVAARSVGLTTFLHCHLLGRALTLDLW